jgi:phosphonate transport system substrate-binding protein
MLVRNLKKSLAVIMAVGAMVSPFAHAEVKEVNFGIISTESTQGLKDVWTPFLTDMSEKMGVKVNPYFATDYAGVIQAMRFGKVDVAWFGNKSAMEAVDRAGGEIFAQTVDVTGNPGYWSLLITHKDNTNLNSVADVLANAKDLTFGNGDPNSTSGFLVPSYYVWAKNGVEPKEIFKRTLNSNHETNALSVATKKVDVATNNTENMGRILEKFPEKHKEIKVLWKSPLIPSDPIVWRKDLDSKTKSALYDFIMSYGTTGDSEELANLEKIGWAPFRPSSDLQLLPIRQLVLYKELIKITNSDSKSKQEDLAEINAKLDDLNRLMAALEVK